MKTKLLFISIALSVAMHANELMSTFEQGMYLANKNNFLNDHKAQQFLGVSARAVYNKFCDQYEYARQRVGKVKTGIPKIIHQIWLGSPLPEKFKAWQQKIRQLHPKWEYKLWTDEDVKNMNLANRDLFEYSKNWGQKSDLLRYEILHKYGGVYLDIDIEMLKPLDYFHDNFDFYACLEPFWEELVTCISVGNAVIACASGHPIMKECISKVRELFYRNFSSIGWDVVIKTGPILFTKCCYKAIGQDRNLDIILPSKYLYPFRCGIRTGIAYCMHHWNHSWIEENEKENI